MLVLSLTACTEAEPGTVPAGTEAPQISSPTKATEPDIFTPRSFNKTATIEETVLYEENGVKITATELVYDNYAVELALVFENNAGKNLGFIANSIGYSCNSVNGYMMPEGYLNCDVADGKKASDTIRISYESLMIYGIYEIADLEIGFDISDDDYNHTYTGPLPILTTAAKGYDYETPHFRENIASLESQREYEYVVSLFDDSVMYEENGLRIVSQTVMENQDGETILLLEVVNDSSEAVRVTTTNIAINGLLVCDSTWSSDTVNPGKTAIVDVNLSSVLEPEYWEILGITKIGNIALDVVFKNLDSVEVASPTRLTITIPGAQADLDLTGNEVCNTSVIRLISKGIHKDPSEYSGNLHILLLAENTSNQTLIIGDVYNSLSVNDYMTDYSFYSTTIAPGELALVDILLWEHGLEEIKITTPEEIETVEFRLSIENENYKELDEVTVTIDCTGA